MKAKDREAEPTLADWRAARTVRRPEPASLAAVLDAVPVGFADGGVLAVTVEILDELAVDADTLGAAVAFDAGLPAERLPPGRLAVLVEGQRAAEKVWSLHAARQGGAEGLRRLLLALVRDLRVVFILLARHLARMRLAARAPEPRRRALAELAAEIHAPLANRLGIWQVKWELEDLAFRYLQPDTYKRIARLLDERRGDRERYIAACKRQLSEALARAGIEADLAGRPKHIFSIWKKMQRKAADFAHLYDIRALRVLVADVPTCYAALGVVHGLWPHVPGEFDDYIARPKGNDYRSLHTAVVGPEDKTLEVQIRTHEMHAHAELGVAAHWRYKEGGAADAAFERKVAAMRALLETRGEADDDAAIMGGGATEIVEDRAYVLTPQGKVIDLPRGGTVLDFAYHVHTEVGHRCRGAKVNGRIVPLDFQPSSGDTVEILTGKVSEPRRDWITGNSGFLNTPRAREKARAWFRHADHARNVAAGREILEREIKRVALTATALDALPPRFELKSLDELYVAIGIGEITPTQVARVLHEIQHPPEEKPARPLQSAEPPRARGGAGGGVAIQGVGNLLYTLARCCQPLPGDPVLGFLTRGRGVSIHRRDCRSLAALSARAPDRLVQVEWGRRDGGGYEVSIRVRAFDRKGLLKDVSAAISNADIPVLAASTRTDPASGEADLSFAIRVDDFGQLSTLLHRIQSLPNVIEARRVAG
ncbi:MAG: bifunctional (p)ppGpp synthetase/guanosine-3',5'-bis(diphosphate) 3'-pyrophosphohydrolase [Xanthomonadaceae bacterium]|jgi:GTP pyrophosphokinase|nr:bifunctional (p)ppGpp synthetase/guanosine-3',5'-bis(diphosphate) 3'-pyrophosphohydrolase [Xanthomonadaceae bacterium]